MSSEKPIGVVPSSDDDDQEVVSSPPEKLQNFDTQDDHSQEETPNFNTEGLRVLAVDDSLVCLKILVALLQRFKHIVTETTNPVEALQILRMRKDEFDMVITDLRMLEMDGLSLLQKISLEMDLPVVMLSADDNQDNIMKAIRYGARDYIIKPPSMAQIKFVWQHVMRKRLPGHGCKNANKKSNSSVTIEETDHQSPPPTHDCKKKSGEIEKGKTNEEAVSTWNVRNADNAAAKKKRRVNWTAELHNKFIDAIEKIGPNAVPMEILKVMNVPWLTRANVASHLQKFKNALRGQAQSTPQDGYCSNGMNSVFQNSLSSSSSSAHGYSMGMMSYGSLHTQAIGASSNFSQRLPYQQHNPNPRMLPLGINSQHQCRILNHNQHYNLPMNPSGYQAPTMLNNAPLPLRNVMKNTQSHPPLPRSNGLRFSTQGTMSNNTNMPNSYSFSQPYPAPLMAPAQAAYPSALPNSMPIAAAATSSIVNAGAQQNGMLAGGQKCTGFATDNENMFPQLDWTASEGLQDTHMSTSAAKGDIFDVEHFQTVQMETCVMDNNFSVDHAQTTTSQEQIRIDDDNDELNNMVNSFNFDAPPSL